MSTYSTNLRLELIGTGEQPGAWGGTTNTNLGTLIEQAISGYETQAITDGADTVITIPDGANGVARNMTIECTGALTAARNLVVPANKKLYFIFNNTSGGFAVTVKVSGQPGVSVPNGKKMLLVCNGTDIVDATNYLPGTTTGVTQATTTSTDQLATTAFVQAIKQSLHPVGSIYLNATNATNPATLLGFGTWVAFGAGRVPVGFNAANTLFDTAEEIGGSYDAVVVSHTHTFSGTTGGQSQTHNHSISISDPGHSHSLQRTTFDGTDLSGYDIPSDYPRSTYYTSTFSATTGITASAGNASQDHSHGYSGTTSTAGISGTNANIQPYITVYMWKRTA
jgi:hypothetical protein